MRFTVGCLCGLTFQCQPPATCPACGIPVTDARDRATDDAWLRMTRDELGNAGTTSYDPHNETW